MRSRTLLALPFVLGACKTDNSLGSVPEAADATVPYPPVTSEAGVGADTAPTQGWDTPPVGPLGPVESWNGWAQNFQFPSGSDTIRLSFASDANGVVVGQVVFGNGTPPPPATDPNVGYPDEKSTGVGRLMEGFPFTMYRASITPNRLRFTIQVNEPWAGWCALQTPASDGRGFCLPAWNGYADPANNYCVLFDPEKDAGSLVVDCGKFFLCTGYLCICSAADCRLRLPEDSSPYEPVFVPTTSFDLVLSGTVATGSMDTMNVYFTKDP